MFQEKILENLQKQRLWEYFPPNSKKRKRKGKEMERYIFFVYITLNISGGGLLVFLDDEIKIIDLFVMLKKYRIDFLIQTRVNICVVQGILIFFSLE